jgi:hypothetical protein
MATAVPHDQHDIFVSYAHVDNAPLAGPDTQWVTNLITGLKAMLGQQLGRADAYSLWMDYELRGNEPLTPSITRQVQNTTILLLILSPGYLASAWCRRELSLFIEQVGKESGRVFIVEREPVTRPEALQDIPGYKFWGRNATGSLHTLGVPKPHSEEVAYYQRLDELARQLAAKLEDYKSQGGRPAAMLSSPFVRARSSAPRATVFLAEVTDDLQECRAEVATYLEQQNIKVLPSTLYYFPNAEELRQAIEGILPVSQLAIPNVVR